MPNDDRIGLRDEDLDDALRALLEQDDALAARHQAERALGEQLSELIDEVPDLHISQLRVPRRRRVAPWVLAGLLLAAATLLALQTGPQEPSWRVRGVQDAPTASVHLQAVAEGPLGRRTLADGRRVHPNERVLFAVETSDLGYLFLDELGEETVQIMPRPQETWKVQAGFHPVGGDSPLAYTTDAGPGARTYRVRLCPQPLPGPQCGTDLLRLVWEP